MTSVRTSRPDRWPAGTPGDDLHIWVCQGLLETPLESALGALDADERERAGGYRFDRDRKRFAASRYMLRSILGHYLQCEPAGITYAMNRWGKPSLGAPEKSELQFNLSRSDEVAVVAFSERGEVGVDVERFDAIRGSASVVRRQFSEPEM